MSTDSLSDLPKSRKEAIAKGEKHYFTGKPCIHGHIAKRSVSGQNCHECQKINWQRLERQLKTQGRDHRSEWARINRNRTRAAQERYQSGHKEEIRERTKKARGIIKIATAGVGAITKDALNRLDSLPKSRKEAVLVGSRFYCTGKPCKNGHLEPRYTWGACLQCHKEQYTRWRNNNPCRTRELGRKRYRNHAKSIRANKAVRQRVYRAKYPDRVKESHKRWVANNKEAVRAIGHRRRARERGATGNHTGDDILFLLAKQRYKCAECKRSVRNKRHIDHIMPLALGGGNDRRNLQVLCPKCNCSKKAKHPLDWARKNGRLL